MSSVTVAQLVADNQSKLGLHWVFDERAGERRIDSESLVNSPNGLVGHLNFIHPNWIQVLGATELAYLESLVPASLDAHFNQLFAAKPLLLVIADNAKVPEMVEVACRRSGTLLAASDQPTIPFMMLLRNYLTLRLAQSTSVHGVCLDVLGMGVIITGDSGSGKSELGLELISRGSALIADDVVDIYRIGPDTLQARCPALLRDFLEVRGLGVLNIRTIFGETSMRPNKNVRLIIHLASVRHVDQAPLERLPLNASVVDILGVKIAKVTIPVAPGRNLAVLVEAAVRNTVLQLRGIDSNRELAERQARMIAGDE